MVGLIFGDNFEWGTLLPWPHYHHHRHQCHISISLRDGYVRISLMCQWAIISRFTNHPRKHWTLFKKVFDMVLDSNVWMVWSLLNHIFLKKVKNTFATFSIWCVFVIKRFVINLVKTIERRSLVAIGINQLIYMWLDELHRLIWTLEFMFECLQKEYICDVKKILNCLFYVFLIFFQKVM